MLRKDAGWHGSTWQSSWAAKEPPCDLARVAAWLGSRKVGRCGSGFALFVPVRDPSRVRAVVVGRFAIVYATIDAGGSIVKKNVLVNPASKYRYTSSEIVPSPIAFRQARRLDAKEEAYFLSLPRYVREMICKLAPANVW